MKFTGYLLIYSTCNTCDTCYTYITYNTWNTCYKAPVYRLVYCTRNSCVVQLRRNIHYDTIRHGLDRVIKSCVVTGIRCTCLENQSVNQTQAQHEVPGCVTETECGSCTVRTELNP